jgi:hypothetical protein
MFYLKNKPLVVVVSRVNFYAKDINTQIVGIDSRKILAIHLISPQ